MPLLFSPMMVDVANGTIITVITTPTKVIEQHTVQTKHTSAPRLSMTSKHPFDIRPHPKHLMTSSKKESFHFLIHGHFKNQFKIRFYVLSVKTVHNLFNKLILKKFLVSQPTQTPTHSNYYNWLIKLVHLEVHLKR